MEAKKTTQSPTNPLEKYWKLGAGIVALFIGAGLVITLVMAQGGKKEKKAQDELFALETLYFKHMESATPNPMEEKKPTPPVDVEKLKSDLRSFATTNKGLVASQMASMYLSDLLIRENKTPEALDLLKNAKTTKSNITNLLLIKKVGQIQADLNQCNEAVTTWDDLLKIKNAQFLKDEVKINQSLCFIEQKDWARAEKILMEVKSENMRFDSLSKDTQKLSKETPEVQSAVRNAMQTNREVEKIIRLIQFRQSNTTGKSGT